MSSSTAVAQESNPLLLLKQFLLSDRVSQELKLVLPGHIPPERIVSAVVTLAVKNPKLLECDRNSLWLALKQAAELGLEPQGALGECYLIPRWNSKKRSLEAVFQPGYRGLLNLAYRSGQIASVQTGTVKEHDGFLIDLGAGHLMHQPALGERGGAIAYYAVARLTTGGRVLEYMTLGEVQSHCTRFRSSEKGPWDTDFDKMAEKTVLLRLSKRLPMATELSRAAGLGEENLVATEPAEHVALPPARTRTQEVEQLLGEQGVAPPAEEEDLEREAIQQEGQP